VQIPSYLLRMPVWQLRALLGESDFHLSNLFVLPSSHRRRLRLRTKNINVFTIEQTLLFQALNLQGEEQRVCCAADQFINFTRSDDREWRVCPAPPSDGRPRTGIDSDATSSGRVTSEQPA
jgi:hypothetical protein